MPALHGALVGSADEAIWPSPPRPGTSMVNREGPSSAGILFPHFDGMVTRDAGDKFSTGGPFLHDFELLCLRGAA
jgi:hypothetical protein